MIEVKRLLNLALRWAVGIALVSSATASGGGFDANGNGVSDVWEARYGILNPSALTDADGDGKDDRQEALEGTDPWDAQSLSALEVLATSGALPFVTWGSKVGKRYQVEGLDAEGDWVARGDEVFGNGGLVGFSDSDYGSSASLAYRVVVEGERPLRPEFEATLGGWDTDQDGQDDWTEWVAGTSLIDPADRLRIVQVSFQSSVTLQWPTVAGLSYRVQMMEGEDWVNVPGTYSGDGALRRATFVSPGDTCIFRLLIEASDSDGDGLLDWEEALIGLDPDHTHTVDVDRRDDQVVLEELTAGGVLSLEVVKPVLISGVDECAIVRLKRDGGLAAITVSLALGGNAVAGVDYEALSGSLNLGFGEKEVEILVKLPAGQTLQSSKRLVIGLTAMPSYQIGALSSSTVSLLKENLINVKDYGALGNGVADDGAAIQQALDALGTMSSKNGLYFPAGTYRLATPIADNSAPTGIHRLLKLGRLADLADRDIVLAGAPEVTLYSDLGSIRANMLMCNATFRTLTVRNIRFEQSSTPLYKMSAGSDPNASDGVTVMRIDNRRVAGIRFQNCDFINCHRSLSVHGTGYDIRGKCGSVILDHCNVLNPYGANTIDSFSAWGGGQQIYLAPWVAEARSEHCVFDGGGEDMTDQSVAPGGRLLDGCHIGSPLRLIFRNNVVLRMGIEAVMQTNDSTYMAHTTSAFTLPPADNVTEITVSVTRHPSTWVVGERVVVRTPRTPGVADSNTAMTIRGFNAATAVLTLTNPGGTGNLAPGVVVASGRTIYLDHLADPTYAWFEDNFVDGTIPPGGVALDGPAGIVFNGRSHIAGNLIRNHGKGIYSYKDVHTPAHPAARGSVIERNVIITSDATEYPAVNIYGIDVWGGDERVRGNVIQCAAPSRTFGIIVRAANAIVSDNEVFMRVNAANGYASAVRCVGISSSDTATGLVGRGNATMGFDVGIGPSQAYNSLPYFWAVDHQSVNDVLAIDPIGRRANPGE